MEAVKANKETPIWIVSVYMVLGFSVVDKSIVLDCRLDL